MPIGMNSWRRGPVFPRTRSDCELWYNARRSTFTFNGTRLSGVTDLSTHGRDGSQATTGRQPLYDTVAFSPHPYIHWDTAARSFQSPSFTLSQPVTIAWVGMSIDPSGGVYANQIPFCNGSAIQVNMQTTNTLTEAYLVSGSSTRLFGPTGSKTMLANPAAAVCVFNGSSSVFRLNGQETTGTVLTNGITGGISWGATGSAGAYTTGMVGYSSELIVFSSALDATARAALEIYLKAEWGLVF